MPLSISTESAFVTAPQLSVVEPPYAMLAGEAVKDGMFGVPEHPVGELDDDEDGAEDDAPPTTFILTVRLLPNNVPSGARMRQLPVTAPVPPGAFIATDKSAVAPGAVLGTATVTFVVIAVPAV